MSEAEKQILRNQEAIMICLSELANVLLIDRRFSVYSRFQTRIEHTRELLNAEATRKG